MSEVVIPIISAPGGPGKRNYKRVKLDHSIIRSSDNTGEGSSVTVATRDTEAPAVNQQVYNDTHVIFDDGDCNSVDEDELTHKHKRTLLAEKWEKVTDTLAANYTSVFLGGRPQQNATSPFPAASLCQCQEKRFRDITCVFLCSK